MSDERQFPPIFLFFPDFTKFSRKIKKRTKNADAVGGAGALSGDPKSGWSAE